MKFRASFCDPFNPEIADLGEIQPDKVMELFDSIPWEEHLQKMKNAGDQEIHFSPSLEIADSINGNGLCVSAVDNTEWYIFFKRPRRLRERTEEEYLSEAQGQDTAEVRACLHALIAGDLGYLENKIP
jgi:hypothetical protein